MTGHPQQGGFTLIELVVFIVVVSVLSTGLVAAFANALKGAPQAAAVSKVAELAQERMELILAQRRKTTFAAFTSAVFDPCTSAPSSTLAPCTSIPAGYAVTATLQNNWNADTNYKIITVTVTGSGSFQLQTLVASY